MLDANDPPWGLPSDMSFFKSHEKKKISMVHESGVAQNTSLPK